MNKQFLLILFLLIPVAVNTAAACDASSDEEVEWPRYTFLSKPKDPTLIKVRTTQDKGVVELLKCIQGQEMLFLSFIPDVRYDVETLKQELTTLRDTMDAWCTTGESKIFKEEALTLLNWLIEKSHTKPVVGMNIAFYAYVAKKFGEGPVEARPTTIAREITCLKYSFKPLELPVNPREE